MREPLDLERPREQLCPVCHDRGFTLARGATTVCPNPDCSAGRAYRDAERVRERLLTVFSVRDAELWLQSRIPALGGERPRTLIREGRGDDVLAAIDLIPGIAPGYASGGPVLAGPAAPAQPEVPPGIPDPEAVRRVLSAQLRRAGERRIADVLEGGRAAETLGERERAVLDAATTGTGFLLDGKRVDPASVEVVRWSVAR